MTKCLKGLLVNLKEWVLYTAVHKLSWQTLSWREYFPFEHQSVSPAFCPLPLTSWPSSHSHANARLSLPVCEKLHWHGIFTHPPRACFFFPVGVEDKLDSINKLKVKGLVLGPFHTVQADRPETLDLQEINPIHGNKEVLARIIEKATRKGGISYSSLKLTQTFGFMSLITQRKLFGPFFAYHQFSASSFILGISVVLDLTPNYEGLNPWFTQVAETVEKVKVWQSFGRCRNSRSTVRVLNLRWLLRLNVPLVHCLSDCCWVLAWIWCWGYQGVQPWHSIQLHWVVEAPGCCPDQSHEGQSQTVTIAFLQFSLVLQG